MSTELTLEEARKRWPTIEIPGGADGGPLTYPAISDTDGEWLPITTSDFQVTGYRLRWNEENAEPIESKAGTLTRRAAIITAIERAWQVVVRSAEPGTVVGVLPDDFVRTLTAELDRMHVEDVNFATQKIGEKLQEEAEAHRELKRRVNSPQITRFLEAVRLEAVHQVGRWGSSHDAGKADADWFWLVAYLLGKALSAGKGVQLPEVTWDDARLLLDSLQTNTDARFDDDADLIDQHLAQMQQFGQALLDAHVVEANNALCEKRQHHLITAAAAIFNWFAHITGEPLAPEASMRAGIKPPED